MAAAEIAGAAADLEAIRAALALLAAPDAVVELRVLKTGRTGTVSGYYTDRARLATDATRWNIEHTAYVTLNTVKPALLARSKNKAKTNADQTTSDADIERRCWFLIDVDPSRPAGISAAEDEHTAALAIAAAIRDVLACEGWPEPVFADSGNGAHLLYRIDLPNDDSSRTLLKNALAALAVRFDTPAAAVDQTTFNAARIVKLYGTVARKGDDTAERPHRLACILHAPDSPEVVPLARLEALAAHAPPVEQTTRSGGVGSFDVAGWLASHGVSVAQSLPWQGGMKWILAGCPWNADHTNRSAYVVQLASGAIAAGCQHNGCAGKGWQDLRAVYEPDRAATLPAATRRAPPPARQPVVIRSAVELFAREFPEPRWAVPGLVVEGLSLLVGAPKLGKSWLSLGIALAVAAGGYAIGTVEVEAGEVLYLGLEDSERRLKDRMKMLLEGAAASPRFHYATEWPRLDAGGVDALEEWLTEHPATRLVVIDTLKHIRPREDGRASAYNIDYDALIPLMRLAQRRRVAIVVVHHTRKMHSEDVFEQVSGTNGLTGAADAVLVLKRARGAADGTLSITGRDVEERDYALRFDATRGAWTLLGGAAEYQQSESRRKMIAALTAAPEPMTPKEIAEATGLNRDTAKHLLWRAAQDGAISSVGGGKYAAARPSEPANPIDPASPRHRVTAPADSRLEATANTRAGGDATTDARVTALPAGVPLPARGDAGDAAPIAHVTAADRPIAVDSRLRHDLSTASGDAVTQVTRVCPECREPLTVEGICHAKGCGYGRACRDCGEPTGHTTWPQCGPCTTRAHALAAGGGA